MTGGGASHYPGGELELFAAATHWKSYLSAQIRPYPWTIGPRSGRGYRRDDVRNLAPRDLTIVRMRHLDAIGLAYAANRLMLDRSMPTNTQIQSGIAS